MLTHEKFKKVRSHFGISQAEMAIRLGIKQSYYSAIERGEKEPSSNVLTKLFGPVGVNEDWWTSEKGNMVSAITIHSLTAEEKKIELKKALSEAGKMKAKLINDLSKANPDFHELYTLLHDLSIHSGILHRFLKAYAELPDPVEDLQFRILTRGKLELPEYQTVYNTTLEKLKDFAPLKLAISNEVRSLSFLLQEMKKLDIDNQDILEQ